MQKNKIKKITIQGFRGVQKTIEIPLKGHSFLLYGDNGTGKSTITDGIEWFFYDKIDHLKGEEISKNEGIRNTKLSKQDICQISIEYFNDSLNSKKALEEKSNKLIPNHSNTSESFTRYLNQSCMENLLIRNDELIEFIIATKSERLIDISNLIGYSEVAQIKKTLKKSVNALKKSNKDKQFDSKISSKQADLFREIGGSINTEEQFFLRVNTIIKDLNLGISVNSWESFEKLEKELSKEKIDPKLQLKTDITKEISNINAKEPVMNQLFSNLSSFQTSFKKLFDDKKKLQGIQIKSLLKEAEHIIKSNILDDKDQCPLCLQTIPTEDLLKSIYNRLKDLKLLESELETLNQDKNNISEQIKEIRELLKRIRELKCIEDSNFKNIKEYLDNALSQFRDLYKMFSKELKFKEKEFYDKHITKAKSFSFDSIKNSLEQFKNSIKEAKVSKVDIATKIKLSHSYFKDIEKLKKEKELISSQIRTLEKIYKSFVNCQKKEMMLFLSSISEEINRLFKIMYPSDNIRDIKLTPILKNEEDFVGVSCDLNFRGTFSSPKMLMSESYLNCLGLCFFLSSVQLFNKQNNFFILDDVISSFDKNHRQKFGQLLANEFSDWQILILTHENEWFKYLSSLVNSKNWIIKQIKWSDDIGSFIDKKPLTLKAEIKKQIEESNPGGLGNKIRRYLEGLLKKICENLESSGKLKFGEHNEKRTLEELRQSLLSKTKNKKMDPEVITTVENLKSSQFFGNESSHDNSYNENLADMKACFQDIVKFEKLFICEKTGEPLLAKHALNNKIQTKSGHLSYNWQTK